MKRKCASPRKIEHLLPIERFVLGIVAIDFATGGSPAQGFDFHHQVHQQLTEEYVFQLHDYSPQQDCFPSQQRCFVCNHVDDHQTYISICLFAYGEFLVVLSYYCLLKVHAYQAYSDISLERIPVLYPCLTFPPGSLFPSGARDNFSQYPPFQWPASPFYCSTA